MIDEVAEHFAFHGVQPVLLTDASLVFSKVELWDTRAGRVLASLVGMLALGALVLLPWRGFSAAALGVAARTSATKSLMVKSIS